MWWPGTTPDVTDGECQTAPQWRASAPADYASRRTVLSDAGCHAQISNSDRPDSFAEAHARRPARTGTLLAARKPPPIPSGRSRDPRRYEVALSVGEDDPDLARGESHPPPGRGGEGGAAVRVRPGPMRGPGLPIAQDQGRARPDALCVRWGLAVLQEPGGAHRGVLNHHGGGR